MAPAAGGRGAPALVFALALTLARVSAPVSCLAMVPPLLFTCFARPYSQNLGSALWHLRRRVGRPHSVRHAQRHSGAMTWALTIQISHRERVLSSARL